MERAGREGIRFHVIQAKVNFIIIKGILNISSSPSS